ncbi:MAG: glycosyltransferase [Acidimicrobiia bacterium]
MIGPALFWLGLSVLGFTFGGFPLGLLALARCRPRPYTTGDEQPMLSVIIAAHNEQDVIAAKIANVFDSDYPTDRIELIVASDGSTDATVATARAAALRFDRGIGPAAIHILDLPRSGKAGALNAAVARSGAAVLVFTDANSMLEPDAIRELVRPLCDERVGGVAGNQVYATGGAAAGERTHWSFDRRLKEAATRSGSIVSATGALYAIRRELVGPVINGVTDDFYISTGVVAAGRRLVFAPRAVAVEPVATSADREFDRKVRIMTRGFEAVLQRRALLDPRVHGVYAVQLFVYKVLRRLTVVPLVMVLLGAVLCRKRCALYRVAAIGQLALWLAGAVGHVFRRHRITRHPVFALPAFVVGAAVASVRAALATLRRQPVVVWDTARQQTLDQSGSPAQ